MKKIIEQQMLNDVLQLIANAIHPSVQYGQITQLLNSLQTLGDYNERNGSGTDTQC